MRYRIMASSPLLKEAVVPQAVVVPKAAAVPQAAVAPQAAVRPPQKFLTAPSACPLPDPLTVQAVFIRHRFLPIP